jgi:hypothetical protein
MVSPRAREVARVIVCEVHGEVEAEAVGGLREPEANAVSVTVTDCDVVMVAATVAVRSLIDAEVDNAAVTDPAVAVTVPEGDLEGVGTLRDALGFDEDSI